MQAPRKFRSLIYILLVSNLWLDFLIFTFIILIPPFKKKKKNQPNKTFCKLPWKSQKLFLLLFPDFLHRHVVPLLYLCWQLRTELWIIRTSIYDYQRGKKDTQIRSTDFSNMAWLIWESGRTLSKSHDDFVKLIIGLWFQMSLPFPATADTSIRSVL